MDTTATVYLPAKAKKSMSLERLIYFASLLISGLSALYLLTVAVIGYSWLPIPLNLDNTSDLVLSLIQCLLGIAALHLPKMLCKITGIKLPRMLCASFYVFVLCGTVLGEMFSLYYKVPVWDSILHFGSGIMGAMLASILLVNYFKSHDYEKMLSPVFIMVAAISFSIAIGVVWEIYEFAADSLLGLNMQKYLLQDGNVLAGQAALTDTMKDLVVDLAGSMIGAVAAYYSLKVKKGWLYSYQVDKAVSGTMEQITERKELSKSA